ncbi:MAG: hypothetical protein Q4P33_01240 [Flaviflexus sp.]|nr:hypothetical protein [Flaviflexus sp.]
MRLLSGPHLTRPSRLVLLLSAIVTGVLTTLLGAVTHAGGIDGGTTGMTVALLTAIAGAAAYMLLGGLTAYLCYVAAAMTIPLGLLAGIIGRGDLVGDTGNRALWLWGTPACLLLGGACGLLTAAIMMRGGRASGQLRADEPHPGDLPGHRGSELHMSRPDRPMPGVKANRYDVREHEKR